MKRHGYLFENCCAFPHLIWAFRKAKRGSGDSLEALQFEYELEKRLLDLQTKLLTGVYKPQPFRFFQIRDPKPRVISVAPFVDRVVHHAVVGILDPIFDPTFIFDSYATRKGKGSHSAILRAQSFLKKNNWFFKADIRQYFANINHDILLEELTRKIKDPHFLLLVEKIIRNGGEGGFGLPVGNLTSQFFANVYLNRFDHWIKEELRANAYVRYMDDFVIFSPDKERVKDQKRVIENYLLNQLDLELKKTACFINQKRYGLSFLGARIFPNHIRVHPKHARRSFGLLMRKRQRWIDGKLDSQSYSRSLESHWAYLSWFDTLALRRILDRDLE